MCKNMTFSEILKNHPVRYQITDDRRFIFDLQNGEKVQLACEYCKNIYWDIGVHDDKTEEKLAFRIICPGCGKGIYLLWIGKEKA